MSSYLQLDDPVSLDIPLIRERLNTGARVNIQFSKKIYTDEILHAVNELCHSSKANLMIRFYLHWEEKFDCRVLEKIPFVKTLSVDGNYSNPEAIARLECLEELSIGLYDLKDKEFLSNNNFKKLRYLDINETKARGINLGHLRDYDRLTELHVEGHTRNIEAITACTTLERLVLRSISKVPLDFINPLSHLKRLMILFGGRPNISEIANQHVKELHISNIRGFAEFANTGSLPGLKTLIIEDQLQLSRLHFDSQLPDLQVLKLDNCKTLNSLTGLENLPNLNRLIIHKTAMDLNQLIRQPLPASITSIALYTGRTRPDNEMKKEILKRGYQISSISFFNKPLY